MHLADGLASWPGRLKKAVNDTEYKGSMLDAATPKLATKSATNPRLKPATAVSLSLDQIVARENVLVSEQHIHCCLKAHMSEAYQNQQL